MVNEKSGYPLYRRRCRYRVRRAGHVFDDTWVASYAPCLLKRYRAHINVQVCSGTACIKYIMKYMHKGTAKATVGLRNTDDKDEITQYLQTVYIGPHLAHWRILEVPRHYQFPAVYRLPFHLPGMQTVGWRRGVSLQQWRRLIEDAPSILLGWFEYNRTHSDGPNRRILYPNFPRY